MFVCSKYCSLSHSLLQQVPRDTGSSLFNLFADLSSASMETNPISPSITDDDSASDLNLNTLLLHRRPWWHTSSIHRHHPADGEYLGPCSRHRGVEQPQLLWVAHVLRLHPWHVWPQQPSLLCHVSHPSGHWVAHGGPVHSQFALDHYVLCHRQRCQMPQSGCLHHMECHRGALIWQPNAARRLL